MKRISHRPVLAYLALYLGFTVLLAAHLIAQDWPMFGHNLHNTASTQSSINNQNVQTLTARWVFTTGGDVSARAAVVGGVAYFPDWNGNIYAVNASNGKLIWSHQLSDYGLPAGAISRTSPAVVGNTVYIGTLYTKTGLTGWLLAIDANNGTLQWMVQPDTSNPIPVITSSPIIAGDTLYIGMTSNEEYLASESGYPCCSARGSVVALNAKNGAKLWQTFTAPAGYSGANVWGSTPVVDLARQTVYVGSGNNYALPAPYSACINHGGSPRTCLDPDDHADSIIALDMNTGAIKWARRLMNWSLTSPSYAPGSDFWNDACVTGNSANCPSPPGPDFDFGSGPNEITYTSADGSPVTIIGAGQKSGMYYALNPDTGALLWQTEVGPGSGLGGIQWGSASDGERVYVAIANFNGIAYGPNGSYSAGSWAALEPATGKILWQVADPNGAVDLGPVAVANGVVYAPSMGDPSSSAGKGSTTSPSMFALDAATGKILWSYVAGSSVVAGAVVVDNGLYWGSGYRHLGIAGFTGNNKFYSFTPNGK
jgi:polyvinyl alcohol dehydrogenase (cytochrome)